MINFAVCDDEQFERERVRELIERYAIRKCMEVHIDFFESGDELLEKYVKGKYTIIFLDIEMGQKDGIMTADRIRRIPDHDVTIMYVTNYPQYMQQTFDVRAAQFFSKPLKYDDFESKLDNIFEYMNEEKEKNIYLEQNGRKILIHLSDIYTIETELRIGSNSNIIINKSIGEEHIKGKLKDYQEQYGNVFIAPSRSVLVNINHVYKMVGNELELDNGRKVTISRNRVSEIKNSFTEHVRREMMR